MHPMTMVGRVSVREEEDMEESVVSPRSGVARSGPGRLKVGDMIVVCMVLWNDLCCARWMTEGGWICRYTSREIVQLYD